MKKRVLSFVLVLAMILSLFPASIFAESEGGSSEGVKEPAGSTTTAAEVDSYEELAAALKEGGEIKLTAGIEAEGTLTVPKGVTVTLDLNGNILSGNRNTADYGLIHIANTAAMTIKDSAGNGKITYAGVADKDGAAVWVEGSLVLESGTIETTGEWNDLGAAVDLRPNAWGTAYTEGAAFTMNGGKAYSETSTAVRIMDNSSTSYAAIPVDFIVNDGTIEGNWAVVMHCFGGAPDLNVTIKDGTIIANRDDFDCAVYLYCTGSAEKTNVTLSGGVYNGSVLFYDNNTLPVKNVSISGGSYNGLYGLYTYGTYAEGFKVVSGGTFEYDYTEYCVDGVKCVEIEAGKYVTAPDGVAAIGNIGYKTLAAAIAAAKDGDTVTLLSDVVLNGKIQIENKKFVLDGNDYAISGTGCLRFMDSDCTIQYVLFDKAVAGGDWGLIESVSSELVVSECTFAMVSGNSCIAVDCDNKAADGDGDSVVTIEGCDFVSNENAIATLYLQEGKNISVENCVFRWNTAEVGVVYIADVHELNMTANAFSGSWVGNVKDNKAVILAGPYTADNKGYAININENCFYGSDNCTAVCVEDNGVKVSYDLNNNYWNGQEPDYKTFPESKTPDVDILTYYTGYENGVLTGKTGTSNAAAMIGDEFYASLHDAIAAVDEEWDTIELLQDVALSETLVINPAVTFCIYGNGYKITNNGATNAALMVGDTSLTTDADPENGPVVYIENIVFDGWNTAHVIRIQGANALIDSCVFQNCQQTGGLALVSFTFANGAVFNSTFKNNTCVKAVDINSWGDGSKAIVNIDGCTFVNNVCASTGVIEAMAGELFYLTNCEFADNSAQSAVVFIAMDSEVCENAFVGNSVANSNGNEATILAGPWVKKADGAEYSIVINENAFMNTNIPGICVENWEVTYGAVAAYDFNNNYWGSAKTNYVVKADQDKEPAVTLDDWYVDEAMTILKSSMTEVETEVPEIEDVVVGETTVKVEIEQPAVMVDPTVENVTADKVEIGNPDATEEEKEEAAAQLTETISKIEVDTAVIAVEQAQSVTAEEIVQKAEELKEEIAEGETIANIIVETTVSVEIKVDEAALAETDAEKAVSFLTVNITPVVTKTFIAKNEDGEKIGSVSVTEEAKVTKAVTVKIPLPAKYFKAGQQMTVIHTKDNSSIKYYHPVTVQEDDNGLYVEFENENGFSGFGIAPAHNVSFVDAAGEPIANADVIVVDALGNIVTYTGTLSEGKYYYVIDPTKYISEVYFDQTKYVTIEVGAEDVVESVLAIPMFDLSTTLGDLPTAVVDYAETYYEAIYVLAFWAAQTEGYIDTAVAGLEIALNSLDIAKDYISANAPAEYESVKDAMLEELDNTKATVASVIEMLKNGEVSDIDSLIAAVLGMEDQLHTHLKTLSKLGYELGLDIDPYIVDMNDAVEKFGALVDATIIDTYNTIVETAQGFVDAYNAWVDEVVAVADSIDPALAVAVRKFFDDSAADVLAILAAYGEEAVYEMFDVATDAAGDIVDVALQLADVMVQHGLTIHEAIKNNAEVQGLLQALKDQLGEIEGLVEEIASMEANAAAATLIAEKEALLQKLYAELKIHHTKTNEVLYSVIADVDEEAAEALCDAMDALCETLCISYGAADGYMGWLADRAEAMACEILCAVVDNFVELLITASPIMDRWMYDWLYNNPETVIAFAIENGEEIEELTEKYGPCVVAVLGYISATYGPEVLDFIINNPCESLDLFMDWYNKYGYRIWPMIDVYLEALGVYDAIDHQLNVVNEMLMDLLDQVDAHILAQIAALNATLKDAHDEMREQIEAEIAALNAALKQMVKENISDKYFVTSKSYYVALGDAGAYGAAADLLAAELGMTNKYANLTTVNATAADVLAALDAAEIAKADLITLGFSANAFTATAAADLLAAAGFDGTVSEKDWAALVGEYGAEAVAAALAELTAYVAEQVGDADIAALLTLVVESYAYSYINHLINYIVVSEEIHEINADALLVLVGMHNPMDGVVIDLMGETLDLGEYLDYLVTVTNIYSLAYALYAAETIYVDAPDVELAYDGSVIGVETLLTDLMSIAYGEDVKFVPTEAGYIYIQEQIYNALNPVFVDEDVECEHAFGGESTIVWTWFETEKGWDCSAYYRCIKCGEKFELDCTVNAVVTKQPTVEEEGEAVYTASVVIDGVTYTSTKTVALAKLPVGPDTGDTAMVGLYVTMGLLAAAAGVVVLKKKKVA